MKVSVLDVNDNAPVIVYPASSDDVVYITADPPVGTTICQVLAQDDDIDANANLTFSVAESSVDGLFCIDRVSGVVTTTAFLQGDAFSLRVSVADQGNPAMSSTAHVVVKVGTSGQHSAAEVGGTSASGVTAIIVGVVCFLVACLGVLVAARLIRRSRTICRQKFANRVRVQYGCDHDDTILSAYHVDGQRDDTSHCQIVEPEVPKQPRPGILRHPSKVSDISDRCTYLHRYTTL